ncbi:putative WD repeat-containing protein [Paramyrothecium foliicola]|nr:putative WD repeat-containing protein [Paramyrothecium foliicola]
MRPLPPLANRLREEAGSLLLDDRYSVLASPRYLGHHNVDDSAKLEVDEGVDLDLVATHAAAGAAQIEGRDVAYAQNNPRGGNDTSAYGSTSLMSTSPAFNNSEPQHDYHTGGPQEQSHAYLVQDEDDLDMDDSDGGVPLHGMSTMTDTVAAMLDSNLDAVISSLSDEDDSSSVTMDTFDSYLDDLISQVQSPNANLESSEDEVEHPVDAPGDFVPEPNLHNETQLQPPPNLPQHPTFVPTFNAMIENMPPVLLSNPNPFVIGSDNFALIDFLRDWARLGVHGSATRTNPPDIRSVLQQAEAPPAHVTYADLNGDDLDFQGIDWKAMGTTRRDARTRRRVTYHNHVNIRGADKLCLHEDHEFVSPRESFFRFKKMNIRQDVSIAHFQLRNLLASPSASKAYYPSPKGIMCMNFATKKTDLALNMRRLPGVGSAITALDANYGVLMAGTFNGDFLLQSLQAENNQTFSDGQIGGYNGITNHLKIQLSRTSSSPIAAVASNDHMFRVMDIQTERYISTSNYPFAPNCTATSPDRRLRVIVGDYSNALITNADTGEVLQQLKGHLDYGFACDWSDDGRTVATAFQDRGIKIWDARRWCNSNGDSMPLHTIRTDMASVRNLRFSPVGSGRRVLVAAEEADYVSIIDAQSYRTKQTVDIFGEIAGIAFTNESQDLSILCCDPNRGGLLELERVGRGPEPALENNWSYDRYSAPPRTRCAFPTRVPAVLEGLQPF